MSHPDTSSLLEPAGWPRSDSSVLFLLDAASSLERRLLTDWIATNRPDDVDAASVQVASIPPSRRGRRSHRPDAALDAFLRTSADDPLLVPMRVIWLAPERDGVRRVGWRDLATFGDPRDPDPLRAQLILRTHPERCRVIMGQAAPASTLRARWASPEGRGRSDGTSLGDYVALQAWLALERAERALRGSRYKVPKFVKEDLQTSRSFVQGLAKHARLEGKPFERISRRGDRYLKEIAANHSPYVIDLVAGAVRWLVSKGYSGLHYDPDELHRIVSIGQQHPIVFIPSHKSNFDHLALLYALYENEMPPNHTAGGINLNFFPVGMLIRRAGVFFIRRTFKDNEVYKFVLREYLAYLLEKRFALEWFIEGGRSRSGKLRAPRFGMLSYVIDAFTAGRTEDVMFVPVAIGYDQISDVGSYAAEQRGGAKEKEGFGWLVRTVRGINKNYGAIHIRFGEPLSLRERLGPPEGIVEGPELKLDTQKLAFEISAGINRATPVTPISLVTLALLSTGDRALTVDETITVLEPFLEYVKLRELPSTETIALDTPVRVRRALDDLTENGVVSRFDSGVDTVYRIGPEQHLQAAYYRNTIIHFFMVAAITELAIAGADHDPETVFAEAARIRDLLKFEFFFSASDQFRVEVEEELALEAPNWREVYAAGDTRSLLAAFRPFKCVAVLRPFIEAYRVVADVISMSPAGALLEPKDVSSRALELGRQYLLQRIHHSEESVSAVLFDNAIRLADNRSLLDAGHRDERTSFADELRELLDRLDGIEALDSGFTAGLFD